MTKLFGIDISEHNGAVNFGTMKNAGVKFAILRSSWGHFTNDAMINRNVAECNRVGMPFGLYHYSYARNDAEARQEATSFLNLANSFKGRTYPLVLDMEDADGWKARNGVTMSQEIHTIKVFKEIIEGAGHYLMLYLNRDWYNRLTAIDKATVDSLDIWLAHWGISEPSLSCGMWQYSSDGSVAGSSARTDVNYCYKDYPSIITGGTTKPTPQPDPQPKPEPAPTVKYGIGTPVTYTGLWTSSNGGEWVPKSGLAVLEGTITKVIPGAEHPYLISNGIGWANDRCIDDEPSVPSGYSKPSSIKSAQAVANEIWTGVGNWGTGTLRRNKLVAYGGSAFADAVQNILNNK